MGLGHSHTDTAEMATLLLDTTLPLRPSAAVPYGTVSGVPPGIPAVGIIANLDVLVIAALHGIEASRNLRGDLCNKTQESKSETKICEAGSWNGQY